MVKNILFFLVLSFSFLNASIDTEVYYTYEKNRFLDIKSIINKQHLFKTFQLYTPLTFGYDSKHNVFIKFDIKNNSNETINQVLVSKNTLVSKIVLYDNKGKELDKKGFLQESKNKNLYSVFPISLKPYEHKVYYLSFESPMTTLIINLDILEKSEFDRWYLKNLLFISMFFGGMLALCIYNIFVYFATSEKAYLFYTLCILATTFHHSAYTGILFLFTNIDYTFLVFKYSAIVVSLPMYFLGLFSKYYLETKKFNKINQIINFFLFIIPLSWIFFMLFPEYSKLRNLLSFIFLFYLLCIATYLAYCQIKQSYYVIAGWSLFFLSGILMVLSSSGTYNIFNRYPYIVEILLFAEAILFSIALSNKIRTLQTQVIILKNKKEQELKLEVAEKTKKLSSSLKEKQFLLKELNHRVKNNMQMILSLVRLQANNSDSEKLTSVLITIEGRISALGHLHELLYTQDDISTIKASDYFELLIDDLVSGHYIESEKMNFNFNLKGSIPVNQAIYCGLIINELVTNSLKHAFKDGNGEIKVWFEETIDKYILKYSDNGIGFELNNTSDSLGMTILTTLAEDQLEGELIIDTHNGMNLVLSWK